MDHASSFKPEYLALIGSRLYGTASSNSDEDYRGFCIPPLRYLVGVDNFEQYQLADAKDTVVYSLRKYLQMLIKGNTQALESLFSHHTAVESEVGKSLKEQIPHIVSQAYYHSIRGFALCEWRKAMGVQVLIDARDDKKTEQLIGLCSSYNLKRYERAMLIDLLEEFTGQTIKTEVANPEMGERRTDEFQRLGYCPKNASHTIRLMIQGIQLAQEGRITFPLREADLLRSIKYGDDVTKEDVVGLYESYTNSFNEAWAKTTLRKKPDIDKLNAWYVDIVADKLKVAQNG